MGEASISGEKPVEARPLSGALIAGGSSRRMGRDKRLLVLNGRTLLERAAALLGELCGEVLYAAPHPPPISIAALHVPDRIPGMGVLGGIHAALLAAREKAVLCIPVDTPLLTPAWLSLLTEGYLASGRPCVPRTKGRVHPVPGCYPTTTAGEIESALIGGGAPARVVLEGLHALYVEEVEAEKAGCDPGALANVNTPEEWRLLLADLHRDQAP